VHSGKRGANLSSSVVDTLFYCRALLWKTEHHVGTLSYEECRSNNGICSHPQGVSHVEAIQPVNSAISCCLYSFLPHVIPCCVKDKFFDFRGLGRLCIGYIFLLSTQKMEQYWYRDPHVDLPRRNVVALVPMTVFF